MRVKMRDFHLAGPTAVAGPGQVIDVDETLGRMLVVAGYADELDAPPVPAVPEVETASMAAPERAVSRRGSKRR